MESYFISGFSRYRKKIMNETGLYFVYGRKSCLMRFYKLILITTASNWNNRKCSELINNNEIVSSQHQTSLNFDAFAKQRELIYVDKTEYKNLIKWDEKHDTLLKRFHFMLGKKYLSKNLKELSPMTESAMKKIIN